MYSRVIYTEEIDDLNEAVKDLFAQAEDFEFRKNTIGILMTEEETDYLALYSLLSEKWKFTIMGCTAMAMLLGKEGYCASGISVLLLTSDDCSFATGLTGELHTDNYMQEIRDVYTPLSESAGGEEKLIIAYGVLVTMEGDMCGDNMIAALDSSSGGVPIFGGLASDNLSFEVNRVFYNDKCVNNGLAMALVSGKIEPRFISVNSITSRANFSYKVTESRNNQIFRLGSRTFLETLEDARFAVSNTSVIGDYLLSPFVASIEQPDGERVEVARNLSLLNHETGSGTFLGAMPEGALLGIGIINRGDVQKSVEEAFDQILTMIEENKDYEYSTFLCCSCLSRFMALASNTRAEAEVCMRRLPEGMNLFGMYGAGEFVPVKGQKSGEDYNMFHNFTFAILAF